MAAWASFIHACHINKNDCLIAWLIATSSVDLTINSLISHQRQRLLTNDAVYTAFAYQMHQSSKNNQAPCLLSLCHVYSYSKLNATVFSRKYIFRHHSYSFCHIHTANQQTLLTQYYSFIGIYLLNTPVVAKKLYRHHSLVLSRTYNKVSTSYN